MTGYITLTVFGKTKTVNVEYLYHIPENVSADEAKNIAFERAKAQAIADEFGTIVSQSNSVIVENSNGNSNIDFLSIGGSELKGEWIETIGEPKYEFLTNGDMLSIKVIAKGRIRELEGNRIPFDVKILRNGIDNGCESDHFCSGDDLYIAFKTPSAGFLAIYLIDAEKNAFCLLPYIGQENGIFEVKANKRYLLFHPDHSIDIPLDIVDQLTMDTSHDQERNRIIIVFSPNKFYKANDNRISEELPRSLSYMELQKWLSDVRKHDIDLSILERSIQIKNK